MKEYGYGYYCGGDPRKFRPDHECCTDEEIENHRKACEAWDQGSREVADFGGWVSENMHLLKAPFGLGAYEYETEESA